MRRDAVSRLAGQLEGVPAGVKERMLSAPRLPSGAAAIVVRFFQQLKARGEPVDAPSRETFDAAAASESSLGLLLRMLEAFAPEVCLAAGREARRAWYERRPRSGRARRRRGPAALPTRAPDHWPAGWAILYPALLRAPMRESSLRRQVASISRCAGLLPSDLREPCWTRWDAWRLSEALESPDRRPATIAGYLDALISLGRHGGLGDDALAGLREMRAAALERARRLPALKVERVAGLDEAGGLMQLAETVAALRAAAEALPACSAAAERLRRQAAVLAITINAWARTGDVASWRLGIELIREPWGVWRLAWTQRKTGEAQDVGELWPAVAEVLDELLLAGRPRRVAHLRYGALAGRSWLSHEAGAVDRRLPSQLVREAIGVPLHDLRTVVADTLRRRDPAAATRLIGYALGHRDMKSGEAYRALCEGDAAAVAWRDLRREIGRGGAMRA